MQKGIHGVLTVEDDIEASLGRKVVAAGRTDKDVSAVSQVISFATFDDVNATDILNKLRDCEAVKSGRLAIFDCRRVPKRFHALFSATWRRYLYVFPLNSGPFQGVDVDCAFVDRCLKKYADHLSLFAFANVNLFPLKCRLENLTLSFNGFAHRDTKETDGVVNDVCILRRTAAFVIDMVSRQKCFPDSSCSSYSSDTMSAHDLTKVQLGLCVELVGSRFLRRMVRLIVVMHEVQYSLICLTLISSPSLSTEQATAVRESVLAEADRNENILLDIATSGNRFVDH
jgi:tRNA U38,U39,U40 pseudouridine synthase TruA